MDGDPGAVAFRLYIPGYGSPFANSTGPDLTSYYSTGKFRPGTKVRWEPVVSPLVGGRMTLVWTDNPEVISSIKTLADAYIGAASGANFAAYANAVNALGSLTSWPLWQEREFQVPTKLRRKRFDIDGAPTLTVDNLDRNCQTAYFAYVSGSTNTNGDLLGSFWFHDALDVEGIHGTAT